MRTKKMCKTDYDQYENRHETNRRLLNVANKCDQTLPSSSKNNFLFPCYYTAI